MDADVFISYKRKNLDFAKELDNRLRSIGKHSIWRDENDLINGTEWGQAIDNALEATALVVLLISPDSMESHYVTYEWCYARYALKKELYFIHLQECSDTTGVFGRLKNLQLPNALNGKAGETEWAIILEQIADRLKTLPALKDARNRLIAVESTREQREQAAYELGQAHFHKTKALEYLIEGIRFQLSGFGDGVVHTALARALGRVGDASCVPVLWEAYISATVQGYPPAREAIYDVLSQLSKCP